MRVRALVVKCEGNLADYRNGGEVNQERKGGIINGKAPADAYGKGTN